MTLIFTATNDEHDQSAIVVKHLPAIAAAENNTVKTQQALDDWYLADEKDYKILLQNPMNGEQKQQELKIDTMSKWCDEAEIIHTPTLFVNGYHLPENYSIEELKNIL